MRRILTPTALVPGLVAAILAAGALGAAAQSGAGAPPAPAAQAAPMAPGDCPFMRNGPRGPGAKMQGGCRGDGPGAGPRQGFGGPACMGPAHGAPAFGGPAFGGPGGGHPPRMMMMKVMFAVADANGDGEVSLEEMQAIQARLFAAMDEDDSGGLTAQEFRDFFRPAGRGPGMGGPGMKQGGGRQGGGMMQGGGMKQGGGMQGGGMKQGGGMMGGQGAPKQ